MVVVAEAVKTKRPAIDMYFPTSFILHVLYIGSPTFRRNAIGVKPDVSFEDKPSRVQRTTESVERIPECAPAGQECPIDRFALEK
ncbi:MAG: hypothetical protein AMJ46_05770 [Latescibacteria bacterium DG_63]|nr:MAG: hypothetical protein AMJ46_05770 [Latescibacteria bacterium DG_63]